MDSIVHMFDNMRTNSVGVLNQVEKYNVEDKQASQGDSPFLSNDKNVNVFRSRAEITSLPNEILHIILAYLDLKTIFVLRSTCKTFYELCSDKALFKKLDLQPYWSTVFNFKFIRIF
jgi:hypothetical protein